MSNTIMGPHFWTEKRQTDNTQTSPLIELTSIGADSVKVLEIMLNNIVPTRKEKKYPIVDSV